MSRRFTVLHVVPGLGSGGGAERSIAATAPGVCAELGALHVAVLTDRRALVDELERSGVVVHDLSHAVGLVARIRAIRRLVSALEPSVVHASLFDADVPTQLAVGRSRPVIVTWTGTPFAAELRSAPGITWWKVQVVRLIEAVIGRWSAAWYQAVTPGVARSNSAALGVDSSRVIVAGRGRTAPDPVSPGTRAAVRAELGVDADVPLVVAIARHEPEKGVPTLLDAFAELVASVPSARLLVAGRRGSSTASVERRIAELGLEGSVRLLGHHDDVDRLLQGADAFVSSSVSEGAAGSILEALAAGVPVVATETAGLKGVLTDGIDALLVPVGDAGALASRLLDLIEHPELGARIRGGGRDTFARRYTVERSAASLVEMYRRVAASASNT